MPKSNWASAGPCAVCRNQENCADKGRPRQECLEFWPLTRPQSRQLRTDTPIDRRRRKIALSNPEVRDIIRRWEAGCQISDDEYLRLRELYLNSTTQEFGHSLWYIWTNIMRPHTQRYASDAWDYYGLIDIEQNVAAPNFAFYVAIQFASQEVLNAYNCPPVPSRFERIVLKVMQCHTWAYTIGQFIPLPVDNEQFKAHVEYEWRRVMPYEDVFHGFTVIPLVHPADLVRYQQLGGSDSLVSRSIAEWLMLQKTFPLPGVPFMKGFAEKAYDERLQEMFEPLVMSYAKQTRERLIKISRQEYVSDCEGEIPELEYLVSMFRSLLQCAINDYDFMHGKSDEIASSVGSVGFASSPEWRDELQARLRRYGVESEVRDIVHVGFTRYVVGVFDQHIREHYAWPAAASHELEDAAGAIVDAEGEVADIFREESTRTRGTTEAEPGISVAFEKDGVQYLYIQQMAFVCGPDITEDQLRNWDRRGDLETLRWGDVDPFASESIASRRVYPYTTEMVAHIQGLAERKEMLQADPREGLLSRKEAAKRLGITPRTLDNWRNQGKIEAIELDHRVFIPETEVERLLAEQEGA